jgi:UDP-N-acetylmuramoyl-tripeptide--D-alanyl-D-alanine ligase
MTVKNIKNIGYNNIRNFTDESTITGFSTNSRKIEKGNMFFALKGDNFDGHKFIEEVFKLGAALAVVEEDWFADNKELCKGHAILIVSNTLQALANFANYYRKQFNIPIIAVAGSNGKTTTKDMIFSVLSKKYKTVRTEANHNNYIGVPLTIFKIDNSTEIAVVEIGTNHPGEIEYLCKVLEPNFGIITNIGREHLEFFKDIEGVRKEETTLFDYLVNNEGTIFVNYDDELVKKSHEDYNKKVSYSFFSSADYSGSILKNGDNKIELKIVSKKKREVCFIPSLPGKHNYTNFLVAAMAGLEFAVESNLIEDACSNFKPSFGRMELLNWNNVTIIKDCYNSNPDSLQNGLETLFEMNCNGKKILVLSDMLEMGSNSEYEHSAVANIIEKYRFEYLLLFGRESKHIYNSLIDKMKYCRHFDDKMLLATELNKLIQDGDIVYIKGSRGMKMEDVINNLINLDKS